MFTPAESNSVVDWIQFGDSKWTIFMLQQWSHTSKLYFPFCLLEKVACFFSYKMKVHEQVFIYFFLYKYFFQFSQHKLLYYYINCHLFFLKNVFRFHRYYGPACSFCWVHKISKPTVRRWEETWSRICVYMLAVNNIEIRIMLFQVYVPNNDSIGFNSRFTQCQIL